MGFSRQEYWSGLPLPSPWDLPDPGTEPGSPSLRADALPSEPPGNPNVHSSTIYNSQAWKQCPTKDGWVRKMWYMYTMKHYSAVKSNEIIPFAAT